MEIQDAKQGMLDALEGLRRVNESRSAEVRSLALTALQTDGAHHKQWYLAQILQAFMTEKEYRDTRDGLLFDEGVEP